LLTTRRALPRPPGPGEPVYGSAKELKPRLRSCREADCAVRTGARLRNQVWTPFERAPRVLPARRCSPRSPGALGSHEPRDPVARQRRKWPVDCARAQRLCGEANPVWIDRYCRLCDSFRHYWEGSDVVSSLFSVALSSADVARRSSRSALAVSPSRAASTLALRTSC